MPAGRPLKFQSTEELEAKINAYFASEPEERWTITGLALALDTSRETLCEYSERPEFVDAVKRAKLKVENAYELSLRKNGRAGDIFGLKNFGWRDQQDLNHGGQRGNPIEVNRIELVPLGKSTDQTS